MPRSGEGRVLIGALGRKLQKQLRSFGTITRKLEALWAWLAEHGVTYVGMESTGVCWKPVYAVLEGHFDLFVGKQVGVFGAVLLAARLGLARLPEGVMRIQLYGGAVLCGIGFTMSVLIGDLAFR